MTGFEIHTTNIRNPHKSASLISIHLAKTEFLYSKLPRPLELKTIPWLGSCKCMINLQIPKVLVCLHKMCLANSQERQILKTILLSKLSSLLHRNVKKCLPYFMPIENIFSFPSFIGLKWWRSQITQTFIKQTVVMNVFYRNKNLSSWVPGTTHSVKTWGAVMLARSLYYSCLPPPKKPWRPAPWYTSLRNPTYWNVLLVNANFSVNQISSIICR